MQQVDDGLLELERPSGVRRGPSGPFRVRRWVMLRNEAAKLMEQVGRLQGAAAMIEIGAHRPEVVPALMRAVAAEIEKVVLGRDRDAGDLR